jgi:hypothetical protein
VVGVPGPGGLGEGPVEEMVGRLAEEAPDGPHPEAARPPLDHRGTIGRSICSSRASRSRSRSGGGAGSIQRLARREEGGVVGGGGGSVAASYPLAAGLTKGSLPLQARGRILAGRGRGGRVLALLLLLMVL